MVDLPIRGIDVLEKMMREPSVAGSNVGTRILEVLLSGKARISIATGLKTAYGRRRQLANVGLLIVGLALGQGTIFLVQTWLVAIGEYELLAAFGTHYSFAILGIIVVDAGASTILARAVAQRSGEEASHDAVWRLFCETCAIRFLIASVVGVTGAVYAIWIVPDGFSRWYVASALPGLLFWSVNGVGLLDGLRLSGISGITGAAAYLVTAIGLALATHKPPEIAGATLGSAFSIGYLLTLGAQWSVLRRRGWFFRYQRVTPAGLAASFRDGFALLFQLVPGQISMRAQLVLSAAYLGTETTALFVYAKQVVSALTQIIGFILRVEFPELVQKLTASGRKDLRDIIGTQKTALYCAVILAAGATGVSAMAAATPGLGLHRAAIVIAIFAPTVLTVSFSLVMIQALAALGAYAAIAWALAISSAVGILVSFLFVTSLHVYALLVGELTFHLLGSYIVYRYLRFRD